MLGKYITATVLILVATTVSELSAQTLPAYNILACLREKQVLGSEKQRTNNPQALRNSVILFHLDQETRLTTTTQIHFVKPATLFLSSADADGRLNFLSDSSNGMIRSFYTTPALSAQIEQIIKGPRNISLNTQEAAKLHYKSDDAEIRELCMDALKKNSAMIPDKLFGRIRLINIPGTDEFAITIGGNTDETKQNYDISETPAGPPPYYSPWYDALFLYSERNKKMTHIIGDQNNRYLIQWLGKTATGKCYFLRMPNYLTEREVDYYPNFKKWVSQEQGWTLCQWDPATHHVDALTSPGFRSRKYYDFPQPMKNSISPDGMHILFTHSEENFLADPKNNELDGDYVYDVRSKKYRRFTSKWMLDRGVLWTPDSRFYLVHRSGFPNSKDEPPKQIESAQEKYDQPGFYFVNIMTGELIPFAIWKNAKKGGGRYAMFPDSKFRNEEIWFSANAWSPDGKYFVFSTKTYVPNGTPGGKAKLQIHLGEFDGKNVKHRVIYEIDAIRDNFEVFYTKALWLNK